MQVAQGSGLLDTARQVSSANQDARPAGTEIHLLALHNISLPPGQFGCPSIEQFFTNCLDAAAHPYFAEICPMQVSAHLLIRRDGELIQFVPFHRRAWHAGESCYQGRNRCHDFSIGIELEGSANTPYTESHYQCLAELIPRLMQAYPGIRREQIVGHSDIAPGRKTDPGPAFDWQALFAAIEVD